MNDSEVYPTEREPKKPSEGKASLHLVGDQDSPFLVDRVRLGCPGQRYEVCAK